MEYEFYQKNKFTYFNYIHKSHIDHVIVNEDAKRCVVNCKIQDFAEINSSDHLPIRTLLDTRLLKLTKAIKRENFHKLRWDDIGFRDKYRSKLAKTLSMLNFEKIILARCSSLFKFNIAQFGYKYKTSCKHATFLVKEICNYNKNGGSPCYVISLDMTKAFDRTWRHGLFYKLSGKIDDVYWRALFNYYRIG